MDIEKLFTNLVNAVYNGTLAPGAVDKAIVAFTADVLMKGVFMGYGADFSNLVYDAPDAVQLANLEKNVYYFSTAKNYQQVLELNSLLRDGDKVRTYPEFKKLALDNYETYQAKYLLAEYKHAVASSQMARQWVDAQAQKETHPNLRYSTAGDSHVRAEHASLNKVTLPIDDAFWNTWYPPNGWGCRCMVQQVQDGNLTDSSKIVVPTLKKGEEMFKGNTAKDGMIYPPKHPYWAMSGAMLAKVEKQFAEIYVAKSNAYYHIADFPKGGSLSIHGLADVSDLDYNKKQATWWLEQVKNLNLKIRPHTEVDGLPNAELLVDDKYIADFKETKEAGTHRSLQTLFKKGLKQECTELFINITHPDVTADMVFDAIRGNSLNKELIDKHHNQIKNYYLRKGEKHIIYTMQEAIDGDVTQLETLFNHK